MNYKQNEKKNELIPKEWSNLLVNFLTSIRFGLDELTSVDCGPNIHLKQDSATCQIKLVKILPHKCF